MIKAEERSEVQAKAGASASAAKASATPRCVCSWKNCRVYQKVFKGHPVWDGVVKLKFATNEPETMALKASIDRNLKIGASKADDWKPGKAPGQETCKYTVACHHWTEPHIRKYRADPKHFSFVKPFSVHGASKYLFKVDPKETFRDPGNETDELLYLQAPLVPKDVVKNLFYQIKDEVHDESDDNQQMEEGEAPHKDDPKAISAAANQTRNDHNNNSTPEKAPTDTTNKPAQPVTPTHLTAEEDKMDSITVSTTRSGNKPEEGRLLEKEAENKRLKEQLESMQSQMVYLHDMVQKLQLEHYDANSARVPGSRTAGANAAANATNAARPPYRPRRTTGGAANDNSRRTGSRSSRSSVPNEIEIESEDDGGWIEPNNDWSDEEENPREGDDRSNGTFHAAYQMQRRNSFSSRASRTSRAVSIVSASKSVKSLPRELELEDDEDDEDSHESLVEEAFDNRSMASSKKSRSQRSSNHRRTSLGVGAKKPHRRASIGTSSHRSGGRDSSDAGSVGGVYQVTALTVTDPYGEQGTYTGSISNSTGMPHGFGRLEYDKAGRWYEGDWKHGRWTGQGRLSNGDGDYYEGGLKNDHKHGRGVMRFADGRIFEGEYVNGQMVDGKMTYQDGSTYSGGWVDGMRHGRGRCVFTDKSVYEGEFKEGEFFGHGKMSWSDGGWYEGEWYTGEMQGFGREVRPDGSLRHEGQWVKGQPIRK